MLEQPLLILGLAFMVPIGFALIGASGLPAERTRHAAVSFLAALGLAAVGYVITGFALQFGGIGLVHETPGYDGLIWEWSALGVTWGPGWGMAGLAGWFLSGGAATPEARTLALTNLPWVLTAALIPVSTLAGRIPNWATGLLGFLVGALLYPLAGNWTWGGGWLANLGSNLGLAQGLADPGGAGPVHLLGAAVALAGLLAFLKRRPRWAVESEPVALPAATFPLLSLLGVGLLFAGLAAWIAANPLLPKEIEVQRVLLHTVVAAASAALFSIGYTGLVAGRYDPLMGTRAAGTAFAASLAAAAYIPAWAALVLGALIGVLTPFAIFTVDRILRWDDPTAGLTIHGLGGLLGLIAVGLLADGTAGVAAEPDFPLQLQAQMTGIAAIGLFGFFAAWLFLMPLAAATHAMWAPKAASPVTAEVEAPQADPGPPAPQSPAPYTPAPPVADRS